MRSILAVSLLSLMASASPVLNIGTLQQEAVPVVSHVDTVEVPDSYIVVFKDHVSQTKAKHHHSWVQQLHEDQRAELRKRSLFDDAFQGLKHTYDIGGALMGYSGHFDPQTIEQVRRHPDVAFVEQDRIVHAWSKSKSNSSVENDAPWGLARISHRDSLNFGSFNKYLYSADGGEGVDVYVIDTGTNIKHVDFEGRASWGKTIPSGDDDIDGNGHGTHCSGTVAGKRYGVAKKAKVVAVKVLRSNGSGTMADVVKGVEFAAASHLKRLAEAKAGKAKGFKGSTANMSLGGGKSPALDAAVNAAVDAGIHFAVAAGNDNADSCNYSPAAAEKAVTVGASTLWDERAYFSNYGKCNDIFAPGLNILSTWIGSDHATNSISGTSMASPHIAGLLAYFLSLQPSKDSGYSVAEITPKELKAALIAVASKGKLSDVGANTANLLAWNGGGSSNYTQIIKDATEGSAVEDTDSEFSKSIEKARTAVVEEAEKLLELMHDVEDSLLKQLDHSPEVTISKHDGEVVMKLNL